VLPFTREANIRIGRKIPKTLSVVAILNKRPFGLAPAVRRSCPIPCGDVRWRGLEFQCESLSAHCHSSHSLYNISIYICPNQVKVSPCFPFGSIQPSPHFYLKSATLLFVSTLIKSVHAFVPIHYTPHSSFSHPLSHHATHRHKSSRQVALGRAGHIPCRLPQHSSHGHPSSRHRRAARYRVRGLFSQQ
jgi:hypothetical protein